MTTTSKRKSKYPIQVYYSYALSERDETLRIELEHHLKTFERNGLIAGWHHGEILAGKVTANERLTHLQQAQLILLLISPDFISSHETYDIEMKIAMERNIRGDAYVIPILLRPVFYKNTPFDHLAMLPDNNKPITSWPHQDEAFANVADGLYRVLEMLSQGETVDNVSHASSVTQHVPLEATPPVASASSTSTPHCDVLLVTAAQVETQAVLARSELETGHPFKRNTIMTTNDTKHTNRGKPSKADTLIVTVTAVEALAVLDIFERETGQHFQRQHVDTNTYFDLGVVHGAHIFMVQSEMGAGGPNGALLTIDEAIRVLRPYSVVMVGIAFGFDNKKFNLGTILVSQQLLGYELQKIVTNNGQEEILLRGDRPHASPRLLNRFMSGSLDWHEPAHVEFGLILSGEKLVDNRAFREKLRGLAPEALGGEMEGSGLYATAYLRKTDWILVKAICDWADGNKGQNKALLQKQAAENAARFTMHVLQQGGFVEDTEQSTSSSTPKLTRQALHSLGTCLYTYDDHSSWVVAVAWSPNGEYIASAGGDGMVRVWDATTGHTLLNYRGQTSPLAKINIQRTIYVLAWAPEGVRVASGGDGAHVYVWNAATGQTLAVYEGHTGVLPNVYALAWSPDGMRIASACSSIGVDKTIHIWDVGIEQTMQKYAARYGLLPSFAILSLAWSPDGTRIAATVFGDKAIRIWNVATGRQIASFPSPAGSASQIVWSHDGTRLASAHSNRTAQVWNAVTGENTAQYRGHTDGVRSIAWSPDDTRLATASNDKTIQLWDAATGNHIYTYKGHTDWATSVSWSPDGTRIASASNDKTVQIWQAEN